MQPLGIRTIFFLSYMYCYGIQYFLTCTLEEYSHGIIMCSSSHWTVQTLSCCHRTQLSMSHSLHVPSATFKLNLRNQQTANTVGGL